MNRILKSRALRTLCSVALVGAVVPAAAWATDETSAPPADTAFIEEVSEGDFDAASTEQRATDTEGAPAPAEAEIDAAPEAPAEESDTVAGSTSPATVPEPSESSPEKVFGDDAGPVGEAAASPATSTAGDANEETQATNDTLSRAAVTIKLADATLQTTTYPCTICNGTHGSAKVGIGYELTLPDGADQSDYRLRCDEIDGAGYCGRYADLGGNGGTLYLSSDEPGTRTVTIQVYENSAGFITPVATTTLTLTTTLATEAMELSPTANPRVICGTSEYVVDSNDIGDHGLFGVNDAAASIFIHAHEVSDCVTAVTSSNPSVLAIEEEDGDWKAVGKSVGQATVTLTTKDGKTLTNTVSVVSWNDLDYSQLKFDQESLSLKPGNYLWFYEIEDYISNTGLAAVDYSYMVLSPNPAVLDTPQAGELNNDGKMTALKPGTATLNLYFCNWETRERVLTDTMTVTVTGPAAPTASTTPTSSVRGNLIASNGTTDDLIGKNNLSLAATVKSPDGLTAAQKQALSTVCTPSAGEMAVPIDLSLVDTSGSVFNAEDEDIYVYTLRLKLEGDLAKLDPATIEVFLLNDEGVAEPVTCWVEGGYLYLVTTHFSQYAVVGKAANGSAGGTTPGDSQTENGNGTQAPGADTDTGAGTDSATHATSSQNAPSAHEASSPVKLAQTGDTAPDGLSLLAMTTMIALAAGTMGIARRRFQ